MAPGEAVWVVSRSGFRRGLLVSGKSGVFPGKAAWFQERLRGFRRCRVVSGEAVGFHESVCRI